LRLRAVRLNALETCRPGVGLGVSHCIRESGGEEPEGEDIPTAFALGAVRSSSRCPPAHVHPQSSTFAKRMRSVPCPVPLSSYLMMGDLRIRPVADHLSFLFPLPLIINSIRYGSDSTKRRVQKCPIRSLPSPPLLRLVIKSRLSVLSTLPLLPYPHFRFISLRPRDLFSSLSFFELRFHDHHGRGTRARGAQCTFQPTR